MNIATWLLAGVIIGWLAYSVLGFNQARGKPACFSFSGLFFAAAIAAALLAIGDTLYGRWGV